MHPAPAYGASHARLSASSAPGTLRYGSTPAVPDGCDTLSHSSMSVRHLPCDTMTTHTLFVVALAGTIGTSVVVPRCARADHGPGASAAGVSTLTAETLKPNTVAFELREDFTEFENLSTASISAKTSRAGSIDLLDRSFLTSISASYGLIENLQIGLTLPYYAAVNARDAEYDSETGETEVATFDPDGIGDLWLTGKYRLYRGPIGQFAFVGGVKFPTGRSNVTNSAGERVEPSFTAGTGSYDGSVAATYSRFLTSQITLDASFQYVVRGTDDGFHVGNRIDGGVAGAYRFAEDPATFPAVTAIFESNVRNLGKTEEEGNPDGNTGGTVLFLSPGVRLALTPSLSFTLWTPVPIVQALNGEQLEMAVKVGAAFVYLLS